MSPLHVQNKRPQRLVLKARLGVRKRALDINKRALYTCKRAKYPCKRAMQTCKRRNHNVLFLQCGLLSAKEPYISTKETGKDAKELCICEKSSSVSV